MLVGEGQYFNLHAHRFSGAEDECVITSLRSRDYPLSMEDPEAFYSVGLHPWDLQATPGIRDELVKVQLATESSQVVAIGEAGLDKLIPVSLDMQTAVFNNQLEIAESAGMPVIIHAVRANQELISIIREKKLSVPLIIHGFRGGKELAAEFCRKGLYLSVGEAVMRSEKLQEAVRQIPLESLFLETDESELDIKAIYAKVAELRGLDVHLLQQNIAEKAVQIFSRSGL